MEEELLEKLLAYIGSDYTEDEKTVLPIMIDRAIESFKAYVGYPESFTEEKIEKDLQKHKYCLFDLVLYAYNKEGIEFQDSHSEAGVSVSFQSEAEIFSFHGIVPYAEI